VSNWTGSVIEATALRLAARMGVNVVIGEHEAASHALEELVVFVVPRVRRCRYLPASIMPAPEPASTMTDIRQGEAIRDRIRFIRVILRAQGGDAALDRLSDKFMNALEYDYGSFRPELIQDSEGGGDDPAQGVFEEHLLLGIRYNVIRREFTVSEDFAVIVEGPAAEGGIFVNGPTNEGPEEAMQP